MGIQGRYLLPHPPIIIPEVGKGEEDKIRATAEGLNSTGRHIAQMKPDTIILITPHGVMFEDAITVCYEDEISGDLKKFGVSSLEMKLKINKPLANKISELARGLDVPAVNVTKSLLSKYKASFTLDHGAFVPLYFVNKFYKDYKLVNIVYASLSDIELYKFGMAVREAVEALNEKVVVIASGDLSHRLKEEGPYGYNPAGPKFDREFLAFLESGDVKGAFSMDNATICNAGECGRRSVSILVGTLEGKKFAGELLSYEGTFGVGYGVMRFNITGEDSSKLEELEMLRKSNFEKKKSQKDSFVRLARESLTNFLTTGKKLGKIPEYVTDEMRSLKRGVFVSLKKHGALRGCIGTIFPVGQNLAEEIIRNAIEAGIHDPRFEAVEEEELMDIDFSVDVLTEPEPASRDELDPKEYGIIVRHKGRVGLLLPDLEGVDTVEEQLSIALKKGGIGANEDYSIQRFKVIRHKEE